MNCQQAQQLLDNLGRDRLPAALATRVCQHLADCTDCRVQQQRTARLQRLLALTRYEQPPAGYLDGVLTEFYRRQAALAIRQSWWARLADSLAGGGTPAWRYALAGAALVACTWGAYWLQTDTAGDPAISAAEITAGAALAGGNPLVTFVTAPGSGTWRPMPIDLPAEPEPVIPATVPLAPRASPAPASGQTPRYVLDRLPIVAASYDPARADF